MVTRRAVVSCRAFAPLLEQLGVQSNACLHDMETAFGNSLIQPQDRQSRRFFRMTSSVYLSCLLARRSHPNKTIRSTPLGAERLLGQMKSRPHPPHCTAPKDLRTSQDGPRSVCYVVQAYSRKKKECQWRANHLTSLTAFPLKARI